MKSWKSTFSQVIGSGQNTTVKFTEENYCSLTSFWLPALWSIEADCPIWVYKWTRFSFSHKIIKPQLSFSGWNLKNCSHSIFKQLTWGFLIFVCYLTMPSSGFSNVVPVSSHDRIKTSKIWSLGTLSVYPPFSLCAIRIQPGF